MKISRIILVLVFGCLCLVPTMGKIPILCVDDAYYWPDAEDKRQPFPPTDSEAQPADTAAVYETAQESVVTFTQVQDTVVKAVIKR